MSDIPTPVCAAGRTLVREEDPDWDTPCHDVPTSVLEVEAEPGDPSDLPPLSWFLFCQRHILLLDELNLYSPSAPS